MEYGFEQYKDQCTSIGVGPKGMADGSTITTHNNDCHQCDFRITHVPARDWPEGSKRPVYDIRMHYPRYVETEEENIHGPDYLVTDTYPLRTMFNWTVSKPIAYIDQVPHTYAYTLGSYAIQNEKQVSIGESTCATVFYAIPVTGGGSAIMHMETLTEIALERCDTARCAIQTIGDLSTKHGFYGPDWNKSPQAGKDEAGEALTISDPNETWVFHIISDDTGTSAVWAAQRVPDDHITAIGNQFIIQEIDLSKPDDFMASSNIFDVASRNNLWDKKSGKPLNFLRAFTGDRHKNGFLATRRVWRVFTLAAPSISNQLSPFTDGLGTFGYGANGDQPYPFSVKVDKPLTVLDIMNMNRDQFEGTPFDLTTRSDAGPFGDPTRYSPTSKLKDPINGVTPAAYGAGFGWERPISLWRTAYSTVTQSRGSMPDAVGGLVWIAPYATHHSQFVPVYVAAANTPSSLKAGLPYSLDKSSNWWIHCVTSNYLSRWYRHTIEDVNKFQRQQETNIFTSQASIESQALSTLEEEGFAAVAEMLENFHERTSTSVRDAWWDFFFTMVGKYRDMVKVMDLHAENFNYAYAYLTVPRSWLEEIGFWGPPGTKAALEDAPVPVYRISTPTEETKQDYATKYPNGYFVPYPVSSDVSPPPGTLGDDDDDAQSSGSSKHTHHNVMKWSAVGLLFGFATGMILTMLCFRTRHQGYQPIVESKNEISLPPVQKRTANLL